jgi:hypothetical protein
MSDEWFTLCLDEEGNSRCVGLCLVHIIEIVNINLSLFLRRINPRFYQNQPALNVNNGELDGTSLKRSDSQGYDEIPTWHVQEPKHMRKNKQKICNR